MLEELYLQALTEGSTLDRTVRVMFVGHKGAGKTTLCRRFLGENITSIRSTEGIDVYIEKFTVDLETRKWTIDVEGMIIFKCPIYCGDKKLFLLFWRGAFF